MDISEEGKKGAINVVSAATGICRAISLSIEQQMLRESPGNDAEAARRAVQFVQNELQWLADHAMPVHQKVLEAESMEDLREALRGAFVGCVNILDGKEKPFDNVF